MSDSVAKILTMALIFDACANIARIIGVWVAMARQEKILARSELEYNARIDAAAKLVQDIVVAATDDK
jgi:hypothetical protein